MATQEWWNVAPPPAAVDYRQLLTAAGGLMALLVAAFVAVLLLRRHLSKPAPQDPSLTGFMLEDLRRLRNQGQLSAQEYARARDRLIERLRGEAPPEEPPLRREEGQNPPSP